MEKNKQIAYPKFLWLPIWVIYTESICNPQDEFLIHEAIARYGLYCEEPNITNPEHLKYFNDVIRPELDRQHRKMDKAIRRREARKQKRLQHTIR